MRKMTEEEKKAKFKLKNIKVSEISFVDRAANKRKILLAKKDNSMTDNVNDNQSTEKETEKECAPDHEQIATLRMLGDSLEKLTTLVEQVKEGNEAEMAKEIGSIMEGLTAVNQKSEHMDEEEEKEEAEKQDQEEKEQKNQDNVEKGLPELMQAQEMLQSIIGRSESIDENDPQDPELMRDLRALVSLLSGNSAEEENENPSPETKAEGDSNTGDPTVEKENPKIPEVNQGDVEKEDIAKREVELEKRLTEEVAKREDLEKRLTDMQDAQALKETEEHIAKNYSNIPGMTPEFAKVLKAIRALEVAPDLEKVLAAANEAIAKGDLFKEIAPQTGDNSGSAYDKATNMAKEICKNESGLTREKAMSRVWKENPELLNEYRTETH